METIKVRCWFVAARSECYNVDDGIEELKIIIKTLTLVLMELKESPEMEMGKLKSDSTHRTLNIRDISDFHHLNFLASTSLLSTAYSAH